MELTAGYPFWLMKDGTPFHYPKLLSDTKTDVVIIGGGISGALTASVLTNAGIECIIVDKRTIGYGSTCASTSLLQYELDIPLHLLIKKIGEQKANRVYRLCNYAIDQIADIAGRIGYNEFEKQSSLFFSRSRSERSFILKEFEARKKAGFAVSLLDKKDILELYGCKADSAILSAEGATINAYSFAHALLQDAIKKGMKVYDRTLIKEIKKEGNALITTDGHHIKTKHIINAAGFEVTEFINKKIVEFYATYAIVSEQLDNYQPVWKNRGMLWDTGDPYMYIRLTKDNRIIVGGRDERFSNKITREDFLEKKTKKLATDFEELFPSLKMKTEFAWSGTFGKTNDSLPYIGKYGNAFYALGFGGNGITFSMLAAEILTDLIQGKENEDALLFTFNR